MVVTKSRGVQNRLNDSMFFQPYSRIQLDPTSIKINLKSYKKQRDTRRDLKPIQNT